MPAGNHIDQAHAMLRAKRLREAEEICRGVLIVEPHNAEALQCLGLIAHCAGNAAAAAELIGQAVQIDPSKAEFHYNLAEPLRILGRLSEAEQALREALRLRPDFAEVYLNLGAVLNRQGKLNDAAAAFRESIRRRPNDPWGYTNLGLVLRRLSKLEEAEQSFREAIRIAPGEAVPHHMLGSCLRESGRVAEAIASFHAAIARNSNYREAHSNLCYAMYFDPDTPPAETFREHLLWAERFAAPLEKSIRPHENDRAPDRPLRIGYVSPNLRTHVVGFFMEPILEHHDHQQFHVTCYADVEQPDELSRRLQGFAQEWRMTSRLNDEQLAELIRADHIDILIDLTLHMKGSRLLTFARKPAPVQIAHLAYCGTSGLRTMNCCITDANMSPPELSAGEFFTERLLPLAGPYWCYRPLSVSPQVGPPPARQAGAITFGSLNTPAKINAQVIKTWAKLLEAVPGSRLVVHVPGGDSSRYFRRTFESAGIASQRLELLGQQPLEDYLRQYNRIDIALDPFPYCGGTTSLDALWMGVPLVTLAGQTPLARAGVTLLKHLGLDEWIAESPEQYIAIAATFAQDVESLARLRSMLRERLSRSALMDERRYVRSLEFAYRNAWEKWCSG